MATKRNLVEKLTENLPYLSKDDALMAVDEVMEYMKDELCSNNRIEIRGFGTFTTREKRYAGQDSKYKTVYYRMSKNVQEALKG